MDKKITKAQIIAAMLADENIKANEQYVAYLEHELELLTNKAANKKPTANQKENENIKPVILANLSATDGKTVTELMKSCEELSALSNQRITALLKLLTLEGKGARTVDGKKSLYTLA